MEAPDFEPKTAPGTTNGLTGALTTPKGSQRDKEDNAKLPKKRPSGRYVNV